MEQLIKSQYQKQELPISEELDFIYLLELLPPLHDISEFAWLPELFSIIGYKSLIDLCKYAGGEHIKIPTIDELSTSLTALQAFYNVYLQGNKNVNEINSNLLPLVEKIKQVYDIEN